MTQLLKNRFVFIIATTVAMSITSCSKDFINLTPPTSLTPQTALASESDLSTALLGAYAGLRNVDFYGRTVPVLGDLMPDNSYQSLVNSNRYTNFSNYSFTVADGNIDGMWNAGYRNILRCNNIINSPLTGSATINQLKGEAYAIRALCYFTLVRYFARPFTELPDGLGVPIVTTYDVSLFPARNKTSEVYALINADLTQAFTLMTRFINSTQFSKYAARALQAKVYLTMGDKTNAKTAAMDVITNGGFTVVTAANHGTYWVASLPRTDRVETLFEVSSDANNNNGFDGLANIYSQSGYGDLLVSDPLLSQFITTDVRRSLYGTAVRGGATVNTVNKFPATFGGDNSDTKVLRLSEMYLIAAEASLPGNEVDALSNLNFITSRRNAAAIVSTGAQLFEDVINERRKELAFEGDRMMDLLRLKRDIVRSSNYPAGSLNFAFSSFRRILPIPQGEVDANPNIRPQQNAGY